MHVLNTQEESESSQCTIEYIDDGVAGIRQTLQKMTKLIRAGKKSMAVREKALRLTAHLQPKDYYGEVCALHAFVRDEIKYMKDPVDVQTPEASMRLKVGDCDDKAVLLCALLESIGHPTRLVAVGFDPGIFEHVYLDTLVGKQWLSCETTEPVSVGWEPESGIIRAKITHFN